MYTLGASNSACLKEADSTRIPAVIAVATQRFVYCPDLLHKPTDGPECASDEEGLHPGLGSLLESFIGGLAVEAAVGAVVVVEVLRLMQLG